MVFESELAVKLHAKDVEVGTKKYNGKVFNGHEPLSGESTTTECGVNYQLYILVEIYRSSPMGND